jgi:metal-responsive CopG/Arc/MetJ family transcriptional regulator
MTVQIDIDERVLAEVDEALSVLKEDREEVFRKAFVDLARKKKREAEIARQYRAAYGEKPVQPDEFDIDEEQLIEVWKDV